MATQAVTFDPNLPKKIQQCDTLHLSWNYGTPPYTIKAVYWPNEYGFRIDGLRSWDILTNTTETSYWWQAGIWGDSTVQMVVQDSAGTESYPAFYELQVDKGAVNTMCEANAPVKPDLAPHSQPRSGGFDWAAPQCPDIGAPTGQIVYMVDSPNQSTRGLIAGLA